MRSPAAALLCLLAACSQGDRHPAPPSKPNVLMILADDLGGSDLGCTGGEIETPNLDALARGGVRYSQFYNTARCWPTRAALLTGYYAQQVRRDTVPGVQSGGRGVRPDWAPLLSQRLRPQGYRAYHSGKWHLDGSSAAGGFDRSYRLEDHDRYHDPRRHFEDDRALPAGGGYATTLIADHAVRVLREHAEKHAAAPFFHYLCFTAPHFPLHAPAADVARYRERYRRGWDEIRQERARRIRELGLASGTAPAPESEVGPPYPFPDALAKLGAGEVNRPLPWSSLTPEQQDFQSAKMAVHAAMVHVMDREIGRVVAQLRAMGALENTLILFLSDNGASAEIMVRGDGHDPAAPPGSAASYLCLGPGWSTACNTPHRRHKTWVHEGGISTPLIAHWPAGIPDRGTIRTAPGHVVDVVPTVLALAGVAPTADPPFPGRDFLGPASPRELWFLHEGNRALRSGEWKLVSAKNQGKDAWELYDLATDRGETTDLSARHPERVREMSEAWERRWTEIQAQAGR
jgi:arylsulfatase